MKVPVAVAVAIGLAVTLSMISATAASAQAPASDSVRVRMRPWRGVAPPPPGADTLDVHSILRARSAAIDSALQPETTAFDTVGLDSMVTAVDRGGAVAADAMQRKRRKRRSAEFTVVPGSLWTYDRVNGLRAGAGIDFEAGSWLAVDADAARAFAANRWAGHTRLRAGVRRFAVDAGWADHTRPFGANHGGHFTSVAALVAGQDRQEYLRRRAWYAGVEWRPLPRSRAGLRYLVHEDRSAPAVTSFHFAGGGTPIERPNPEIDAGTTRGIELVTRWATGHGRLALETRNGAGGGELGGDFDYSWHEAQLSAASPIWAGGSWQLRLEAAHRGETPPAQAVPYLGGDGNLRGFAPLEFSGRTRASVRAEYVLAHDLFAHTGIPFVRALHLQFIPFVDAGTTWGEARHSLAAVALDGRWKSSVGVGIQRNLDYPGFGAVRLDLSRRTDGGPGGAGIWFRILPWDDD